MMSEEKFLRKLGRYEILSEIGRGGMSTVYRGRDPRFERDVAVKLLPREFLHDPTFIARFSREAKTIAGLEHAAIVPVYDFGEEKGQPYLIMRYMTGGSLVQKLEEGALTLDETYRIIERIASALDEAHQKKMIHRDLKPGNILFDHHDDAFLSDFGIVKLTQETTTFTGGGIIGTPAYMSPEQARGDPTINMRSDIYALGAMLFEMLSGKPPYEADTPMGLAVKHITEPIPRLSEVRPDLPSSFEKLIDRAMCKEPEGRFNSTGEMAQEFATVLAGKDVVEGFDDITTIEPLKPVIETPVEPPEVQPREIEPEPEVEPEPDLEPKPEPTVLEPIIEEVEPTPPVEVEIPVPVEVPVKPRLKFPRIKLDRLQEILFPFISRLRRLPLWALIGGAIVLVSLGIGIALLRGVTLPALGSLLSPTVTPVATVRPEPTAIPEPMATPTHPPVVGPQPSQRIGIFYYPWYGNPDIDDRWIHWEEVEHNPPQNISSDYYPLLGPYSSMDPAVVAQHCAWLREAGVGVIITSWWGRGSREDEAVSLLLDTADRYGMSVAFHIEPYGGRTSTRLLEDIKYLYEFYGSHPAFFRTSEPSRWSPDDRPKGLFFVWLIGQPDTSSEPVEPEYWQAALDRIHELPDGGLVIANTLDQSWIDRGHFDGLYNYASLSLEDGGFFWAQSLPPEAWYVPSVLPGFSAKRVNYPLETYVHRQMGEIYGAQWEAALGVGVEPKMITITSFNEWHEGTQIEPAASGEEDGRGYKYVDYGGLGPEGYLNLTRELGDVFHNTAWPDTYRARIRMTTSSDWTFVNLIEGADWIRPNEIFRSDQAEIFFIGRNGVELHQPIERAEAGGIIELVFDVLFTHMDPDGTLVFEIERGHLGLTQVELFNDLGPEPIFTERLRWGGVVDGDRNAVTFEVPASKLSYPP
jgi:serine/threonine-protein kinase